MADPNSRQRSEILNSFHWVVPVTSVLVYILSLYDHWREIFLIFVLLVYYFYVKWLRAEEAFPKEEASGMVKVEEPLVDCVKKLSRECGLCCEICDVDEMESLFSCEHMCCKTCIKKYFEVLLREKSIYNCSCPFCNKPDLTSDKEHAEEFFKTLGILLQRILDPPMYDMYLQKVLDQTLNNNPCFKWCSKCSSGFDINPGQKRVACNDCGFVQCSSCKCEWENAHDRMTCEEFSNWKKEEKNTQKLEKYLETAEKVICPACKFVFLLDRGGCLHFVCSQCKHEFCSGCQQQFFHKSCNKNCIGKGLHAHHPRNCLYFLRDYPPSQLQQILTNNKIHFYTERNGETETCVINVRNETPDGLVDALCGVEAPQGFAGLCKNHYVEYLCKVIWDANVDVSPLAEISNAELGPEATKSVPLSQADNTSVTTEMPIENRRKEQKYSLKPVHKQLKQSLEESTVGTKSNGSGYTQECLHLYFENEEDAVCQEKAHLVYSLINLGFSREKAIDAAESCDDIDTAIRYLTQKCDFCSKNFSAPKKESASKCSSLNSLSKSLKNYLLMSQTRCPICKCFCNLTRIPGMFILCAFCTTKFCGTCKAWYNNGCDKGCSISKDFHFHHKDVCINNENIGFENLEVLLKANNVDFVNIESKYNSCHFKEAYNCRSKPFKSKLCRYHYADYLSNLALKQGIKMKTWYGVNFV